MTLWTAVRDDINGTYCAKPRTEYFSAYPLTKTVLLRVLTFLHVYIKCKLCVWKLDSNRLTINTMSIQNFHFNLNKLGRHVHPLSDASKCFAICWAWSKVLPTQLQKVITLKKMPKSMQSGGIECIIYVYWVETGKVEVIFGW